MWFWIGYTAGVATGAFCMLMGLRWEWRYRSLDTLEKFRLERGLPVRGTK